MLKLNNKETKVIIATGQLLGEGFDCSHLSCLFLIYPIGARGRLLQYIGRIQRPSVGKNTAIRIQQKYMIMLIRKLRS